MDTNILGAVINSGSVIVGVGITLGTQRFISQSRKHDVRRVLHWEIDCNRKAVETFWRQARYEPAVSGEYSELELMRRMVTTFLPSLSHTMWASHSSELASILSKDEFSSAYELHGMFDSFAMCKEEVQRLYDGEDGQKARSLREAEQTIKRQNRTLTPDYSNQISQFQRSCEPTLFRCEGIYNCIHRMDNPIKNDESIRQRRLPFIVDLYSHIIGRRKSQVV